MVKLTFITPSAADVIAYAARFSTATQEENLKTQQEKDNGVLVKKLIKKGHFACLEFADAMFEIECSRACSHQLVRHRHMSFVQESQRYVSMENFDVVIPPSINIEFENGQTPLERAKIYSEGYAKNHNEFMAFWEAMDSIEKGYKKLIKLEVLKEDARYILPNACKTKLVMKGNFRSWIDFLKLRLDKKAQWEIRAIANEILDILKKKCPVVFENVNYEEVK